MRSIPIGHVFIFSRGSTSRLAYGARSAQLLEFNANGKGQHEIGHIIFMLGASAHSGKVDKDDNIWVAVT